MFMFGIAPRSVQFLNLIYLSNSPMQMSRDFNGTVNSLVPLGNKPSTKPVDLALQLNVTPPPGIVMSGPCIYIYVTGRISTKFLIYSDNKHLHTDKRQLFKLIVRFVVRANSKCYTSGVNGY